MSSIVTKASVEEGQDMLDQKFAVFVLTAERHRLRFLWQAQRIASCREEAEDIVQDALLKAFKGLPRFRGDSRMDTWLHSIVRNTVRDHLRSQSGRNELSLDHLWSDGDEAVAFDPPDSRRNPEECCESGEMEEILLAETNRLSAQYQRVLQLCVFEEGSQHVAAEKLHVKVATVKSRAFNAKQALAQAVRTRCGIR